MDIKKIQKLIPKENIYINEPMSKHTSFKIGGPAEIFIKIKTIEELQYIIKIAKQENIQLTVIGNGSNILVLDKGKIVMYDTKEKIYQDEKLEKLGFNLPFIVKLSHNLMLYDLLDRVYFDSGEVMKKLWP